MQKTAFSVARNSSVEQRLSFQDANNKFSYDFVNTVEIDDFPKDKKVSISFGCPNPISHYRSETIETKEPDTIRWMRKYGGQGDLLDIGANVGLYSLYYAKLFPDRKVIACEGSYWNLCALARNAYLNKVEDRILIMPNPAFDKMSWGRFNQNGEVEGTSMCTFGVDYGFDGKPIRPRPGYYTLGLSLDDLLDKDSIDIPSMVKIDVDGVEHVILSGAPKLFSNKKCKTVLVEVNEHFEAQREAVENLMKDYGFVLEEKNQGEGAEGRFAGTYNYIYSR